MSRRSWIILGVLACLAIGSEVLYRRWSGSRACVQIVNETNLPMESLVVTFADSRVPLGSLAAGGSANVFLNGKTKGPLLVDYRQKGGSMSGFQIPEFDPAFYSGDHSKLVLTVTPTAIQRFVEADESSSTSRSLGARLSRWIEADLNGAKE